MGQVAFRKVLAVAAAAALLLGWAHAQAQGNIYSCTNAQGQRITADRPIASCNDREQRVLSPTGVERKRIGPVLTGNELAALREEQYREQRRLRELQEQRRRETALVGRYPDRASHDAEREQQQRPFDALMELAQTRMQELKAMQVGLRADMDHYQKDNAQMPLTLLAQVRATDDAVKEQARFLASVQADRDKVSRRLDEELQVLEALWRRTAEAGAANGSVSPNAAAPSPMPAAPASAPSAPSAPLIGAAP